MNYLNNLEVVSAAILRVFGQTIAEFPLVATREKVQGQAKFEPVENQRNGDGLPKSYFIGLKFIQFFPCLWWI